MKKSLPSKRKPPQVPAVVKPVPEAPHPLQLLQLAIQNNVDIDKLRELMALEKDWRETKAREAYNAAMTAFKAEPTRILRTKTATVRSDKGGGSYQYMYAPLIEVVDALLPALSKHGFTHKWETSFADSMILVSCILSHVGGHSERATLPGPPDVSGGKNPIQAVGSTVSYLQRYTLLAVTGFAAADQDNDGQGGSSASDDELMTHAEKMQKCPTTAALAQYMNGLDQQTKQIMMPTYKKRREELSHAAQ